MVAPELPSEFQVLRAGSVIEDQFAFISEGSQVLKLSGKGSGVYVLRMASENVFKVQDIVGPEILVERLHEMGFYKGILLSLRGRGPFGGPYLVQLETVTIALRETEWKCLELVDPEAYVSETPSSLNSRGESFEVG